MAFAGLRTSSWVTDTGEVVREESPLGLLTVRESPEDAQRLAIGGRIQGDMLESAAVQPRRQTRNRIDDPRDVRRIRIRIQGADLTAPEMRGAGQSLNGDVLEIVDARTLQAGPADPGIAQYLRPEPFIESDDPGIRAEAETAIAGATDPRVKAERLVRRVNALLDKKPTVSLPSAREVLRTKVGDCNEHTVLYVAMARSVGLPARIAVGLAYSRGAFYYHAWPEVYIDEGRGRGLWLPVDPTFNQFPADATHVRMMRGGLDRQAAILPLIGHLKMDIIDLELAPNSTPILVGRGSLDAGPVPAPFPGPRRHDLLDQPGIARPMIAIKDLVKRYGTFTAVDGVSLEVAARRDPRLPRPQRRRQDHHDPDDRRAAEADLGHDPGEQPRSRGRPGAGQGVARLHSRSPVHLREAHRRRVPALPRRALRAGRRHGDRPGARRCSTSSSWDAGRTSWSRASRTA